MSLTDHIAFSKKLDDLLMKRGLMEPTDEFLYKAAISKEVAKYSEHKDLLNKAKRKEKVGNCLRITSHKCSQPGKAN